MNNKEDSFSEYLKNESFFLLIKPENDIYFHFDTLQISRCFNNLIKNAIEAPEPPSEELTKYIWAED